MKKFTKVATALVLMLAMLFGSAIMSVPVTGMLKAEAASIVASGDCGKNGDNLKWRLDSSGTLTISGTGAMASYLEVGAWITRSGPWYGYNIKKVVIGNGVTSIGECAFSYCDMTSVSIGSSVKTIGSYAFDNCHELKTVTIPSSVVTIGFAAFAVCDKLTSVTMNNGVQVIKNSAFQNDPSLTTLYFPVSLRKIEHSAFYRCPKISKVYYAGTESQFYKIDIDDQVTGENYSDCGLYTATFYLGCKAPAKPKNVKAVSRNYKTIEIHWDASSNATGYHIYSAESKNGPFTYAGAMNPGSAKGCSVSGLDCGKTYYFKVRAYKRVGGRNFCSGFSSVISVKPIPARPNLTVTKASRTAAKLTWKKVAGAHGYDVYRSNSKTGTYKKIKSTTALSFKNTGLTAGRTYWYKVRAYRKVNGKKVYSYSALKGVSLK